MKDAARLLDRLGLQHVDRLVLELRRGSPPQVTIDRRAKPGEAEKILEDAAVSEETKLAAEDLETRGAELNPDP